MAFLGVLAVGCGSPTTTDGSLSAFTDLRLFDGTGRPPVENATIVVQNGRVSEVGPSNTVTIPSGATVVSLEGRTVVPGLINAHGHVNDASRDLETYAAYGVTTVFSLGGETDAVFAARDAQDRPGLERARVFVAGPVLEPRSPDEARTMVAEASGRGVDLVKIRVDDTLGTVEKMPPDVYRAVIDEAHRRNLRVATHLFYLDDAKGLLDAGTDLLAHSVRDDYVDAAFIAALQDSGVCLVPTLMREVSTFVYESTPAFFSDPAFLAHADLSMVDQLRAPAAQARMASDPAAQRYKRALDVARANLKRLSDAGIPIAMGTDTGPPGRFQGYFEWLELEQMVDAGLTPTQALVAATAAAAACHHVDADLGSLQPGRWADMIVLDADPLEDISNIRRQHSVWIGGRQLRPRP